MKYAIVGTGSRHAMFADAITTTYGSQHQLVGLCDQNPVRLAHAAQHVGMVDKTATYATHDFERMIVEKKPEVIIVAVPDALHHDYIVRAMKAGCDVITEKPMTTDLERLKTILDAQAQTGKKITVAFNYRYTPARSQIKALLSAGEIGTITAIDFTWYLDRVHGADYFRRWHRYKNQSGGLLVHKSTHHFDLVNWWLESTPSEVNAHGKRHFYTPEMAKNLGLDQHSPRCTSCTLDCDFRLDLAANANLNHLYLAAEKEDGYWRDRCVFDADISIEDTMQVHVNYANQASMNYSLYTYAPWEGLDIRFYGTKGELWHRHVENHGVFGGKRGGQEEEQMKTTLHIAGRKPESIPVWEGKGDHGGADPIMLSYLLGQPAPDPYQRSSTHIDGAWSILTGIIANLSMEQKQRIQVQAVLDQHAIHL